MSLEPLAYRCTIGVIGHRRFSDRAGLKDQVSEVVAQLSKALLDRQNIPVNFAVLTPLAEGADRLVAEVVLEQVPGATLKVVLPLVQADYLEDFESEASRQEFHRLLGRARMPISLREKRLAEEYDEANLPEARRLAYEDVGRFVVEHCDVLLALWDELPSRGRGGTAEIVEYAKKNGCPVLIVNPVKPLDLSRIEGVSLPLPPVRKLAEFNRRILSGGRQVRYEAELEKDLYGNSAAKDIPAEIKELVRKWLIPYYGVASAGAMRYQNVYYRAGRTAFVLALVAVGIVAGGAIFLASGAHHTPPGSIFLLEAVILAAIGGLIFRADRMQAHKKWIEHRFLAERLRSAAYLVSCGIEPMPLFAKHHADPKLDSYEWTLFAHGEIIESLPPLHRDAARCGGDAEYIRQAWVEAQKEWHQGKAKERTGYHKRFEHWGVAMYYLALALALVHLFLPTVLHALALDAHAAAVGLAEQGLTWLTMILPAVAATLEALRAHRDFRRLAEHSEQMAARLDNLAKAFRLVGPKNFEPLLRQTEKAMLEENQEWMTFVSAVELYKSV